MKGQVKYPKATRINLEIFIRKKYCYLLLPLCAAPPLVTQARAPSVIFVASVMGCSTASSKMTTAPQFKATAVTDLHHSPTAPANSRRRNTRNGFLIN